MTTRELRKSERALLRRIQRQQERKAEEKSKVQNKSFTPLWSDSLGFEIEDSIIFPEKKQTRLALYKNRSEGRR